MRNPHRAIGRVDRLPPRSAGAKDVYAQILLVDTNVNILCLGKHRDRGGRSVNPATRLGFGYALYTMNTGLEF